MAAKVQERDCWQSGQVVGAGPLRSGGGGIANMNFGRA